MIHLVFHFVKSGWGTSDSMLTFNSLQSYWILKFRCEERENIIQAQNYCHKKNPGILWALGKWKVFLISEKLYNFYIVQNSICKKQPPSTVPYVINGITVRGQTQSSTDLLDFLLIVSNITSSPTVGRYFAIVIWYMEFYIINCLGSLLIWWLMLYSLRS